MNNDATAELQATVQAAYAAGSPLRIRGSGSKAFLHGDIAGEPLDATAHRGIIGYEPSELVLTARAGTPLAVIEAVLAEHGQMLACEPPHYGRGATLGGAVACGLSGPRRPYAGALRDFVLGARIINGRGEVLNFGGQVMKNVAGFDVSRLMAGAMGTLGVLLQVSLKVLPRPAFELTLCRACSEAEAIALCAGWAGSPLPLSASAWLDGVLTVRLSGARVAVEAAASELGGDVLADAGIWQALREHTLPFYALHDGEALWRLSLPPSTPPLALPGRVCLEWGGAQRWLVSALPPAGIFAAARAAGGHAMLFRAGGMASAPRIALDPSVVALQQRLRQAFDPAGILNPGMF